MINYYISAIKRYTDFNGRASRAEYWFFVLASLIVSFAISLFLSSNKTFADIMSSLYALFIFIPSLAISFRRLHDIGKSGWYLLLWLLPIIGTIWIIVLLATKGQSEANAYGQSLNTVSSVENK